MHPFMLENFNKMFFIEVKSDSEKEKTIEFLQDVGCLCNADGFSGVSAIGIKPSGKLSFLFEEFDDFKFFPDQAFISYCDFINIPKSDISSLFKTRIKRSNLKEEIKSKIDEIRISGLDNIDDEHLEAFLSALNTCQKMQKSE